MKLVVLLAVVLMLSFFCGAELGDEWDSFDGDDGSASSSVGVNVDVGGSDDVVANVKSSNDSDTKYTSEFYIALGVGAFGFFIVAVFVYFFLRKPKNRWKKRKANK